MTSPNRFFIPAKALALASLLGACGRINLPSSSVPMGHYEDSSAQVMSAFQGQQAAVAEYAPSQGVIIALPLLRQYDKQRMAAALVNSNIDTLWVTVPDTYPDSEPGEDFAPLRTLLGSDISKVKLVKQQTPGAITVWARDWAPVTAKTNSGTNRWLDFNYYFDRKADDATAQSLIKVLPFQRVSVPVYNEGGNFMNNRNGICLMSLRVRDANTYKQRDDDLVLSDDEISKYYKDYVGCKDVKIFPRMPYEGTGHIDMWAKFMSDDTLIVGELREEPSINSQYSASEKQKLKEVRSFLNERAKDLLKMGFQVVRIPMPAVILSDRGETFRSYTNSLLLNGKALVPRYVKPAYSDLGKNGEYIDKEFQESYEHEVDGIYGDLGFDVSWIDSDDLIAEGGAVHCTTMQVAR